jgi:hypothetical protein
MMKRTVTAALAALLMSAAPALAASGIGAAIDPVVYELMVFVMAIFVGYYVVWSVTPALHTPLSALRRGRHRRRGTAMRSPRVRGGQCVPGRWRRALRR